ncbi:MAG TPA: hypothetical protein VE616_12440 [Candidatus Udaeobacter sp.]|nr:hypothetical protein [Candidatus Udaeobacter sp.]
MADIRGVGKKITYSEDNAISAELEEFRKKRDAVKREPKDDAERELLARWLGHRGRDESFCGNTLTSRLRTCGNFPRGGSIFISMSSAFRPSWFTSRIGPRKFPSPQREYKTH